MAAWNYKKGLHETGKGIYSYLQPDGSWGWSNSGLVVDGGSSLLVDTLFDASLTREMLKVMADATGIKADDINTLVNTHANGDHTHGNGLCSNAEIIASEASAREMAAFGPEQLHQIMQMAPQLGETGKYSPGYFRALSISVMWRKSCPPKPSPARTKSRWVTGKWSLSKWVRHTPMATYWCLLMVAIRCSLAIYCSLTAHPSCGLARWATGSRPVISSCSASRK